MTDENCQFQLHWKNSPDLRLISLFCTPWKHLLSLIYGFLMLTEEMESEPWLKNGLIIGQVSSFLTLKLLYLEEVDT